MLKPNLNFCHNCPRYKERRWLTIGITTYETEGCKPFFLIKKNGLQIKN